MPHLSPSSASQTGRSRRLVLAACTAGALLLASAPGFFAGCGRQERHLLDLKRQLVLAQAEGNRDAVGEIARRISRADASPDNLLAVSTTLVQARLFDDLEATLEKILQLAPDRAHDVLRLRAQAAAAQSDWTGSIARWEEYLAAPAASAPDRVAALDELLDLLVKQAQWGRARLRSDERLGLADSAAARLTRAHIEIRLRQWPAAQEDFRHLTTTDSANPAVKTTLPAWERLEQALAAIDAADATVNASPRNPQARFERVLLCTRLGLWQNAADDLQTLSATLPSARMPALFASALGLPLSFATAPAPNAAAAITRLPWLATSTALAGLLDRFDGQWPKWQRLLFLDTQLATDAGDKYARADRARLLCELGFAEPASNEAQALLKEQPGFLPAHAAAILALLQRGEITLAVAQVDRAITAQAEEPGGADPELQRLFALVWQAQGRHAEAVEMFTTCLQVGETRPDLLRARAKSLRQLQRFTEAAQDLATAERLEAAVAREDVK